MQIIGFKPLPVLKITEPALKRYNVPLVKTKFGPSYAAVFSDKCYKKLNPNGTYFWEGHYDPNMGLFGQKAIEPGKPAILVGNEWEALRLASLGYNAMCLAEPKLNDDVSFSILADNLKIVTKELHVYPTSSHKTHEKAMEKFLLMLARTKEFTLKRIDGADDPIHILSDADLEDLLEGNRLSWRPKGITTSAEIFNSKSFNKPVEGFSSGYDCIDEWNRGLRKGELVMFTAGTGVGKSTIVREIAYHLGVVEGAKVGMVFLEEHPSRTLWGLAGIRYDIPIDQLRENPNLLTKKQNSELRSDPRIKDNYVFHNHFGSLDSDELFAKIDYMIEFQGVDFICLDHISIAISGMSSKEGERKDIDVLMTKLASRCVQHNVGVLAVCHLNQPMGKPHEEGGRVTLSNLRGSGGIKQMSWTVYALERDQQDSEANLALIRQLKSRETGKTGPCGVLKYYPERGRLLEDTTWDAAEFAERIGSKGSGGIKKSGSGKDFNSKKFISPY